MLDAVVFEEMLEAVRGSHIDEVASPYDTTRVAVEPSILVFSGGTAMNQMCRSLQTITDDIAYVMPITDNGGSTSEIVRVLGGPAIGDIRSRLVRLADDSTRESRAVAELLQYRLPSSGDELAIKAEWMQLVEGSHRLWNGISEQYKDTIRAFLVNFNTQILIRASREFNFYNGSVGNFFFTGARLFFGSLEAAIFLFSGIARIPPKTEVIPIVKLTFEGNTIGAVLKNGDVIIGQHEISHPAAPLAPPSSSIEHQLSKYKRFSSVNNNIIVNKQAGDMLPSPISKIFYVNRDGHEVQPVLNKRVLETLQRKRTIIYSCGSLYTSIIPTLIVDFIGTAIAMRERAVKILLLNGYPDRETAGMTAADFVTAITKALNSSHIDPQRDPKQLPAKTFIDHVVYVRGGQIPIEQSKFEEWGIMLHECQVDASSQDSKTPLFDEKDLIRILRTLVI